MMKSSLAREGKVDVRRDEEQNIKLSEILKLLVEAGYHRARIKGLPPFDKIIGGMTWCIEVCSFDIDVDLLFHDSFTIGQKISLTEKIVKVLPRMKCPHRIEPHQIQGLDSIHILPIVKWLVKLAVTTRSEFKDETKDIAIDEFNRNYYQPSQHGQYLIEKLQCIKLKYGPQRLYKRKAQPQNQNEKIITTLYEYTLVTEDLQVLTDSDEGSEAEDDKELQTKLSKEMILDESTDIIYSETSQAKTRQELMMLDEFSKVENSIIFKEQEVANLTRELENKTNLLQTEKIKQEHFRKNLETRTQKVTDIQSEIKQLEASYSSQDDRKIEQLSILLEENESAKKKVSAFKEKCRKEADILRNTVSDLKEKLSEADGPVDQSLIDTLTYEQEKFQKFRTQIGKKTREIETLKRLIDDVPGRAEISQYQRRFIELYNLVRAAHHETLQFYNMYNTLADSRSYMEKESALLNSVYDNMEDGLSTSSKLEEYFNQLDNIIDGIKENKVKLEKKRTDTIAEKSLLSSELNRLKELQLLYATMLHQFSQEISRNEILLGTLK